MKVLFCSSFGGHWVQLKRVSDLVEADEKVFITTRNEGIGCLNDFSARDMHIGIIQFPKAIRLVKKIKPDVVISTGAAPGLLILLSAFLLRKKTIWIDSIANSKKISLSCRAACLFSSKVLTQWPELESSRIKYYGRLL
jgi:UDP-N-acetylglucosamine:LPS N-acetylglucosamine transferase